MTRLSSPSSDRSVLMGFVAGALGGMIATMAKGLIQNLADGSVRRSDLQNPQMPRDLVQELGRGAMYGGVYGVVAEYIPGVRSGVGTAFGTALGLTATGIGLMLGEPTLPGAGSAGRYATRLASHTVYGASTEVLRRVLRG